jgi:hypothetical protein
MSDDWGLLCLSNEREAKTRHRGTPLLSVNDFVW